MKIYTKTGDQGITSLLGGVRVPKSDLRIDAYGSIDELNSYIGLLRDQEVNHKRAIVLKEIQDRLFTLGSYLASAAGSKMVLPGLFETDVEFLEKEIDRMTAVLPELRNFVLPGASANGAHAHIARCVCRRTERLMVALLLSDDADENRMIKYINRLSDYLFTLSRYVAKLVNANEIEWKPRIN